MNITEAIAAVRTKYPDGYVSVDLDVGHWVYGSKDDTRVEVEWSIWIGQLNKSFKGFTLEAVVGQVVGDNVIPNDVMKEFENEAGSKESG